MINKIKKINNIIIQAIIAGVFLLVPVYFSVFFPNNSIFELNKVVLFKLLVIGLLFFSSINILFLNSDKLEIWRLLKRNIKYVLPVFIYFLFLFLSSWLGGDFAISIDGIYNRFQGLETQVYYFLLFILLIVNIQSIKQLERHLFAILISSFLVGLYGIFQALGISYFNWIEDPLVTHRVFSTLGQPNFLASYLLLVIPIVIYFLFKVKNFLVKFLIFLVLILEFICLVLTYSRGGWLGFLVGLFFVAIIYLFILKKNNNILWFSKKRLIAIASLFVFSVFIGVLTLGTDNFVASRVKQGFDLKNGSLAIRINAWQSGIDAISKKPIVGYGLETQAEIFYGYYQKDEATFKNVNSYPNRAHNIVLDILLVGGFAGLAAWLLVVVIFLRECIFNIKDKKFHNLSLAILVSLVSYLLSLMFSFEVVSTSIIFWSYLAFIVVLRNHSLQQDNSVSKEKAVFFRVLIGVLLFMFVVLVAYLQVDKQLRILYSDYYFAKLTRASARGDYTEVISLYEKIYQSGYPLDYYVDNSAMLISESLDQISDRLQKKLAAITLVFIERQIDSNTYNNQFALARLNSSLAKSGEKERYDISRKYYNELIKASPEMPRNYFELGRMYLNAGNINEALSNFNMALNNLPGLNDARINFAHRQDIANFQSVVYSYIGDAFYVEKNYNEAIENYKKAYKLNIFDFGLIKKIADTYYLLGDIESAKSYNYLGYRRDVYNSNWPLALAMLFEEQGDRESALNYAQQAHLISPDDELVNNILQELTLGNH